MRITIDKTKCLGCGACVALCPDIFVMGPDDKARPKKKREREKINCAKEAAQACPSQAITAN